MGVNDFMTAIFWTRYFIAAQGYNVKDNCLHKDNKISNILEKNGKASSKKIKKHNDIWYLFITDRVKNCEVSVLWCTIGGIIGDYMTKPL